MNEIITKDQILINSIEELHRELEQLSRPYITFPKDAIYITKRGIYKHKDVEVDKDNIFKIKCTLEKIRDITPMEHLLGAVEIDGKFYELHND